MVIYSFGLGHRYIGFGVNLRTELSVVNEGG